ncbi:MAG: peptidoglycan-binding protein, partial [Candidatus Methylomirabilales bacterium]
MRRSEVEQLQRNLVALGYDLGKSGEDRDGVDGYFGGKTRMAIERLGREIRALFDTPGEPSKRLLQLIDLLADAGWNATPPAASVAAAPPRHPVRLSYQDTPLIRNSPQRDLVREAQRHLRQLGYLRRGIDGLFGGGTERAVRALQFDLLYADDTSAGALVPIQGYNRGRVRDITGRIDPETAACIRDMLDDPRFVLLPSSRDPAAENARIDAFTSDLVPMPFLRAILRQESGLKHFEVPTDRNEDRFIVLGLDTNDEGHPEHVTSRGYGVGQYTLFHHPPTQ